MSNDEFLTCALQFLRQKSTKLFHKDNLHTQEEPQNSVFFLAISGDIYWALLSSSGTITISPLCGTQKQTNNNSPGKTSSNEGDKKEPRKQKEIKWEELIMLLSIVEQHSGLIVAFLLCYPF
uniref:Uncharacterized protein n=1 Tax=Opuntia streptacantha TaxID=393608 RepID=A0A7C9EW03_OPUST